jgi:hypothetical protein
VSAQCFDQGVIGFRSLAIVIEVHCCPLSVSSRQTLCAWDA